MRPASPDPGDGGKDTVVTIPAIIFARASACVPLLLPFAACRLPCA
jgi:hypothetical protein